MPANVNDELAVVLTPWLGSIIFLSLWTIAAYIITGVSLYDIGKRLNIRAYGLAWVPIAYAWSVGAIADKLDERGGKDRKFRWALIWLKAVTVLLLIAIILMYTLNLINMIKAVLTDEQQIKYVIDFFEAIFAMLIPMSVVGAAAGTVEYICYYKLIELCKPEKPLKNLLIGLLVPFAFPFMLLSCRNALEKQARMEAAAEATELPETVE